ncbi:hypothetical protein Rleg5DRAFT_6236 [Rhizobium leguminosarum bv. viciae WSM1455]|nr:hypothetical protein Rleg5DRAFT_6236 [Rhizobium leguminosarum bv. viciae WSM1455]
MDTRAKVAAYLLSNPRASLREIQRGCGLSSASHARFHVSALRQAQTEWEKIYAEGFKAGQEAMRERVVAELLDRISTVKTDRNIMVVGGNSSGKSIAITNTLAETVLQDAAASTTTLPIEEPKSQVG